MPLVLARRRDARAHERFHPPVVSARPMFDAPSHRKYLYLLFSTLTGEPYRTRVSGKKSLLVEIKIYSLAISLLKKIVENLLEK